MRWRDLRFEKPTKEDGLVLVKDVAGGQWVFRHDQLGRNEICWLPVIELPQPDLPGPIPDGWRAVDKAVDKRDPTIYYRFWHEGKKEYVDSALSGQWFNDDCYIVPIEPPAPQYRPFATWQEWWPHRDRWVRWGLDRMKFCWRGPCRAAEHFDHGVLFMNDDGTDAEPFGVLITEASQ
jgi:hypothetical protein